MDKHSPDSVTNRADLADRAPSTPPTSSARSASSGSGSASRSGVSMGTPTVVEYHHVALYLGEGPVYDWNDPELPKATLNVTYNAFPADGGAPHFFFSQTVTPLTSGNLYQVTARHSSSASATRDPNIIPVKLHSKGTPASGEYLEICKLPREVIVGEPRRGQMYALIGLVAAAPKKQTFTKEGRSFDLTTILVHVLDQVGELHLTKIKMWGSAPAEARKGVALRAIGLTKSEFKGDASFEASKLTSIQWGYKDPKDSPEARDVAEIKHAVAVEENDDDADVREVEVVLRPGAPRLGSPVVAAAAGAAAASAASSSTSGSAGAASTSAKRGSASKAKKARVVDEEEEDED